ncbi:hypothetical protein CLAIMM_09244 [Cladophialophora immunda]|nr:hypothetical protein CLAIMM_09244 [Cladophialophora immunda]
MEDCIKELPASIGNTQKPVRTPANPQSSSSVAASSASQNAGIRGTIALVYEVLISDSASHRVRLCLRGHMLGKTLHDTPLSVQD